MLRILSKRAMLAASTIVLLTAGAAAAQESPRAAGDDSVVSLNRLSADAFVMPSHAPTPMARVQDEQERARQRGAPEDEEETHRWDAIKTGFFAGLALGGLVGIAVVSDCGHPECGPLLPLAAGIGASIGIGIDALVDRRPTVEGVSAQDRPARGRRLSIAIRKSW
jgi:hypothetical protein